MREGERFPCLFKGTSNAAAPGPWDPPATEPARRSFTSTSTNTAGTGSPRALFTRRECLIYRCTEVQLTSTGQHRRALASSGTGAHLCSRCGTPFRMKVQDGGTPVLQVGPPSGHRSGQQGSAGLLPGVDFPCVCRFLARYSGKSGSKGSRLRADARAPSLNDGRPE